MIPTIDPQVKHVGVSHLRKLNADTLRALEGALVICENSEPLAVIVTYEMFLRIQQATVKSLDMVEGIAGGRVQDYRYLDAQGVDVRNSRRGKVTRETRGGKR